MKTQTESVQTHLPETIEQACHKIAPLWPLSHFVAVNPFVGFADQSFAQTAAFQKRIHGADTVMPLEWYQEKYTAGEIGMEDIRAAITNAVDEVKESFSASHQPLTTENLITLLEQGSEAETPTLQPGPFSGFLDQREHTYWQHFIREETAKWCAAYFDQGQSSWAFPWKSETLYYAWKQAASQDRSPQCSGLKQFNAFAAQLPDTPMQAIEQALETLEIPQKQTEEFLYQIMLIVPGWAGHMRYHDREKELRGETSDLLTQLLAIILNYEVILYHHFENDSDRILGWKRVLIEDPTDTGEPLVSFELAQRLLWQTSFEHSLEQTIKANIRPHSQKEHEETARPDVQAAFCIDVRSEVFRRSLETVYPGAQTIGFAGFFGVPIEHHHPDQEASQARCPVLLAPQIKTCSHGEEHDHESCSHQRHHRKSWKQFREAASSSFSFVETLGLSYAYKLLKDALAIKGKQSPSEQTSTVVLDSLEPTQKADIAENILKGLSLTKNFARLVLLCGHGSTTKNNPYDSALDCGACGGHSGDANAQVAVALLNDVEVRKLLHQRGLAIPKDTHFIAGLHNTTTDEVTLFDLERTPIDLMSEAFGLQAALDQAGKKTAMERSRQLFNGEVGTLPTIRSRSRDWSQVRPEWGLAGNTAFIVAPREWTREAKLNGRTFLHDYNASNDPEAAILEAIMGGPLVVGSWINLQYYGSTVDNANFGSGHKAIHNVVGGFGVALGNENDLRPGLPMQSIHDGNDLVHEPSRLLACIAADPKVIDNILSKHPHVKDLVENNWIHLVAMGADGQSWERRLADGQWQSHRHMVSRIH